MAPDDPTAFVAAARRILSHPELRASMGWKARAYAEKQFNISGLRDHFEEIVEPVPCAAAYDRHM